MERTLAAPLMALPVAVVMVEVVAAVLPLDATVALLMIGAMVVVVVLVVVVVVAAVVAFAAAVEFVVFAMNYKE